MCLSKRGETPCVILRSRVFVFQVKGCHPGEIFALELLGLDSSCKLLILSHLLLYNKEFFFELLLARHQHVLRSLRSKNTNALSLRAMFLLLLDLRQQKGLLEALTRPPGIGMIRVVRSLIGGSLRSLALSKELLFPRVLVRVGHGASLAITP